MICNGVRTPPPAARHRPYTLRSLPSRHPFAVGRRGDVAVSAMPDRVFQYGGAIRSPLVGVCIALLAVLSVALAWAATRRARLLAHPPRGPVVYGGSDGAARFGVLVPTVGRYGVGHAAAQEASAGRQPLQGRYPAAWAVASEGKVTRCGAVIRRAWWQVGKQ